MRKLRPGGTSHLDNVRHINVRHIKDTINKNWSELLNRCCIKQRGGKLITTLHSDDTITIDPNATYHFMFVGYGPCSLINAYILRNYLGSNGISVQIVIVGPSDKKHCTLKPSPRRSFKLSGSLKTFAQRCVTLNVLTQEQSTIIQDLFTFPLNDIQIKMIEILQGYPNVQFKLFDSKENFTGIVPAELLSDNTILCDHTGGRNPIKNVHDTLTMDRLDKKGDYLGVGRFIGSSFSVEVSRYYPAQFIQMADKLTHLHLLCGSSLIRTNFLEKVMPDYARTIELGCYAFLSMVHDICLLKSSDTVKAACDNEIAKVLQYYSALTGRVEMKYIKETTLGIDPKTRLSPENIKTIQSHCFFSSS